MMMKVRKHEVLEVGLIRRGRIEHRPRACRFKGYFRDMFTARDEEHNLKAIVQDEHDKFLQIYLLWSRIHISLFYR